MLQKGCGRIINTASMASLLVPHPQKQIAYNASKAAVVKITETLGAEWADRGLTVNCMSPGIVNTALIQVRNAQRAYSSFEQIYCSPSCKVGVGWPQYRGLMIETASMMLWGQVCVADSSSADPRGSAYLLSTPWKLKVAGSAVEQLFYLRVPDAFAVGCTEASGKGVGHSDTHGPPRGSHGSGGVHAHCW